MNIESLDFLKRRAEEVAPLLLGCILERQLGNQIIRVKIVETEAYDQTDAASHSYRGSTARTEIMFGSAGYLYVYFTYGMHYCCNVVTGAQNVGEAVLIRAVEPLLGVATMQNFRPTTGYALSNGPAKLCQALDINLSLNGHDLAQPPLQLIPQQSLTKVLITTTRRIGISQSRELLRRFYITDNPYVSRP